MKDIGALSFLSDCKRSWIILIGIVKCVLDQCCSCLDLDEAGAGCVLLAEVADFSLPLSFGINRIFLQFHSCTVP